MAVFFNVLIHFVGEVQVTVNIAGVGVVRVRDNRKILLRLVLQNLVAPGRIVVMLRDLRIKRPCAVFAEIFVFGKLGDKLIFGQKVPGHHCKN